MEDVSLDPEESSRYSRVGGMRGCGAQKQSGDAGGAGSGGQLLVFHPRGTRQDGGSGTCVLRCRELCLPSLLILTCVHLLLP